MPANLDLHEVALGLLRRIVAENAYVYETGGMTLRGMVTLTDAEAFLVRMLKTQERHSGE